MILWCDVRIKGQLCTGLEKRKTWKKKNLKFKFFFFQKKNFLKKEFLKKRISWKKKNLKFKFFFFQKKNFLKKENLKFKIFFFWNFTQEYFPKTWPLSYGHTTVKAPHPIRTAKLSTVGPDQYFGIGISGAVCLFYLLFLFF